MANRFIGETAARVGEKTFTLRMDFNAMAALEDFTKREENGVWIYPSALDTLAKVEASNVKIGDLILIVLAALYRHHPDATKQDAGDILSEDPEVCTRLLGMIAPEAEVKDATPGNLQSPMKKRA